MDLLYTADNIDPDSLRKISEAVELRKLEMEMNDEYLQNVLLYEFLEKMIQKHEKYAEELSFQLERLKSDKRKIAVSIVDLIFYFLIVCLSFLLIL